MSEPSHAGAILTIDLGAIAANYRLLREMVPGAECACVVKADAYGLGMDRVAPALAAAGCRTFFVAQTGEGIALRNRLPEATIHVLNGLAGADPRDFTDHNLVPVLNNLAEIEAWARFCRERGTAFATDIHADTAMSRLGLTGQDVALLAAEPGLAKGISVSHVMSHLACAEEQDNPLNGRQLAAFGGALAALPPALSGKASLANSSAIFLGSDYHFDMVRAGAALYGIAPVAGQPNPMAQVVSLQGKILQVREIDTPQTVGYGATHRAARKEKIATVAVGYADGYLRSLSNSGGGYIGGIRAPVVGRVSMDLTTLDVSSVPDDQARPGALVELIGPHNPIDQVAADAGTIAYEILTSLGSRYHRVYTGGGG
ncbi:MAG: alanine racemase [Rhodospirillales bacterium]|jgi:alanine racemase|nr:alanine racemase [Rhodospirillaceae bacterium]MDP6573533.1 alanine racemase [Rhodospirillales bacterium]MDP6774709.1 alanine racemase [Rhodospirillales bacterium]